MQTSESSILVANLKNGIWLFGIASWLFGITDRSIASFSDGLLICTRHNSVVYSRFLLYELAVFEARAKP